MLQSYLPYHPLILNIVPGTRIWPVFFSYFCYLLHLCVLLPWYHLISISFSYTPLSNALILCNNDIFSHLAQDMDLPLLDSLSFSIPTKSSSTVYIPASTSLVWPDSIFKISSVTSTSIISKVVPAFQILIIFIISLTFIIWPVFVIKTIPAIVLDTSS